MSKNIRYSNLINYLKFHFELLSIINLTCTLVSTDQKPSQIIISHSTWFTRSIGLGSITITSFIRNNDPLRSCGRRTARETRLTLVFEHVDYDLESFMRRHQVVSLAQSKAWYQVQPWIVLNQCATRKNLLKIVDKSKR